MTTQTNQKSEGTPKLDDRFIQNIKGKDFVLYAGVLDLANQKGLQKLEVKLLQFPTKENGFEAICHAVAEGKDGQVFSDIGDANPNNCTPMIAKHLIRMASTRAKGRCLRDMCNISIACLEELESMDDVMGNGNGSAAKPKQTTRKKATPRSNPAAPAKPKQEENKTEPKTEPAAPDPADKKDAKQDQETTTSMSDAQKRALLNLSRRRGISVDQLENLAIEDFGTKFDDLTTTDASALIRTLQQAA